jgi:pyrrolidone-carboxylate peptidase
MMTVTAFGPFGTFKVNPSEVLGRALVGDKLVVLPVSFGAVDEFLATLPVQTTKLLMLGVAAGAKQLRLERMATDQIGSVSDIDGANRMREGSMSARGTLFNGLSAGDFWMDSDDAGSYLCNYVYYEVNKLHPKIASGFIHVPSFTVVPFPLQLIRLRRIVQQIQ